MRRVFRLPTTRRRLESELDDELAFHLERRTERLIANGLTPDAARREALRQFGDVAAVRESCFGLDHQREQIMRRADVFDQLRQDVAYALRTLARNRTFAAVVITALALGIGANAAIFSLVDAVLLRRLPVSHPEQLVAIGDPTRVSSNSDGAIRIDLLSAPLYRDLRRDDRVFSGLLASGKTDRLDVRIDPGSAEDEHPRGRYVSGNYFAVLGVRAFAGRTFDSTADAVPGAAHEITISHGYWVRRFHGARDAIGRRILLDGVAMTIVGVTPPEFTGEIVGQSPDLWIPLAMHDALRPNDRVLDDRFAHWLLLAGRLKPGATLARARQELAVLLPRDAVANVPPATALSFKRSQHPLYVSSAERGFSRVRVVFRAPLVTLMIGVALLLVIICANVATLLTARGLGRGREMAVRVALGAGRGRLVRQLLTESLVLAIGGALAGLFVAWAASRTLVALAADGTSLAVDAGVHPTVLWFTLAASVATALVFGLVPALRASRADVAGAVRGSAVSASAIAAGRGQRAPLGRALIVGQVVISVVLLVGAAMLVRSLRALEHTDIGVDADHLLSATIDVRTRGLVGDPLYTLAHALRDRVAAVPGVAAVTYSENGLFSGNDSGTSLEVPGFTMRSPDDSVVRYDNVGPGFIGAVGGRMLDGVDLAPSDEGKPARTAVVNQALASFYFPHERAVGRYLRLGDSIAVRIVGVAADVRDHALDQPAPRRIYFPYAHTDTNPNQLGNPGALILLVRTAGDPARMAEPVRAAIRSADPAVAIDELRPLPDLIGATIRQNHLVATLATAFGALALLFAAVGLYGVMSYAVSRRTGEIGLRVALGADRGAVLRLIITDAVVMVGAGVAIGLPVAMLAARSLRSQLHGVAVADPASIGLAVGVLLVAALAASVAPARRAAAVSPMAALRQE